MISGASDLTPPNQIGFSADTFSRRKPFFAPILRPLAEGRRGSSPTVTATYHFCMPKALRLVPLPLYYPAEAHDDQISDYGAYETTVQTAAMIRLAREKMLLRVASGISHRIYYIRVYSRSLGHWLTNTSAFAILRWSNPLHGQMQLAENQLRFGLHPLHLPLSRSL